MVSSSDGYCSFVRFEGEELGTPSTLDRLQHNVATPLSRPATPSDKDSRKPRRIKPIQVGDVMTTPPTRRITPTPIPDAPLQTPTMATPTVTTPTIDTSKMAVPTPNTPTTEVADTHTDRSTLSQEEKKPRRVQLITLT